MSDNLIVRALESRIAAAIGAKPEDVSFITSEVGITGLELFKNQNKFVPEKLEAIDLADSMAGRPQRHRRVVDATYDAAEATRIVEKSMFTAAPEPSRTWSVIDRKPPSSIPRP